MPLHLSFSLPENHIFTEYFYWNLLSVENGVRSWEYSNEKKKFTVAAHTTQHPFSLANSACILHLLCFFFWVLFPDQSSQDLPILPLRYWCSFNSLVIICITMLLIWRFTITPDSLMQQWTCCISFIFVLLVQCLALNVLIDRKTKLSSWFF